MRDLACTSIPVPVHSIYRMSTKKVHFSFPVRRAKMNFFCGHPIVWQHISYKVFPYSNTILSQFLRTFEVLVIYLFPTKKGVRKRLYCICIFHDLPFPLHHYITYIKFYWLAPSYFVYPRLRFAWPCRGGQVCWQLLLLSSPCHVDSVSTQLWPEPESGRGRRITTPS